MQVAIINYNAGNVRSVLFAMERLQIDAALTDDPERIKKADRVIFPGVGEASTTMQYLRDQHLDDLIRDLRQPVLGICLGMQLLCSHSEENNTACLGIIPLQVKRFHARAGEKVPHMGWNALHGLQSPLFTGIEEQEFAYFVHSYYVESGDYSVALSDYIHPFSAAIRKDNFYATQFHPEKSGEVGERILRNFMAIND